MMPKIIELRGHHFCEDLVPPHPVILDLGGHKGEFSREMARKYPGAESLIVEADPSLYEALQTVGSSRKIWGAASGADGEAVFHASENPEGGNIFSEEGERYTVKTYGLATLFEMRNAETVDLMKVDIEGAELELFEAAPDALLGRFRQLTIEFHDFLDASHGPRIEALFRRFETLGFLVVRCSMRYHRDVLIVRKQDLADHRISPSVLSFICRGKAAVRSIVHNLQRTLGVEPR